MNPTDGPAAGASDIDVERVTELLGRRPVAAFDVVVRDPSGDPVVIRNHPLLPDGTPMPTRYWLVGREAVAQVSRLEAAGGVRMAETVLSAEEIRDAHDRYAAERDAVLAGAGIPDDQPRPFGGVGGTREGVKCLHAHYAWHLAGGDDPVGRWVASQLGPAASNNLTVAIDDLVTLHARDHHAALGVDLDSLTRGGLLDRDPPHPADLTNALGEVLDALDDVWRDHPALRGAPALAFTGTEAWHLVQVERGRVDLDSPVSVERDELEDLFRTLATERRAERLHNPALDPARVDTIVAACCVVLALMRSTDTAIATFARPAGGGA